MKSVARWLLKGLRGDPDSFLRKAKGVIHVGANVGPERDLYAARNLNVLWVEPIPDIFDRLKTRLSAYPDQRAFNYLVTDVDEKEYSFHIASNDGGSSSIYEFAAHKEIWPDVTYTKTITIKSITLDSLIKRERIEMINFDALIMDTQGSELLVLKGAANILRHFRFIKTEVADFESYRGCCRLMDMDEFLQGHGYKRVVTKRVAHKHGVGSYYDVLYELCA
jgi:FkbM family methyltransferase